MTNIVDHYLFSPAACRTCSIRAVVTQGATRSAQPAGASDVHAAPPSANCIITQTLFSFSAARLSCSTQADSEQGAKPITQPVSPLTYRSTSHTYAMHYHADTYLPSLQPIAPAAPELIQYREQYVVPSHSLPIMYQSAPMVSPMMEFVTQPMPTMPIYQVHYEVPQMSPMPQMSQMPQMPQMSQMVDGSHMVEKTPTEVSVQEKVTSVFPSRFLKSLS